MRKKFYIQHSQVGSKEVSALHSCALMKDYRLVYGEPGRFTDGHIPYGDVPFCEAILNKTIEPDYFPSFFIDQGAVRRHIWSTKFPTKGFIKPLLRYKSFTGYLYDGTAETIPSGGPFLMSEEVVFNNEWRYYVTNGKIVLSGWYWGDEVNTPEPPEFPWRIPEDWSGTVDIGDTHTGLQIVECHHPFACGFYGKLNLYDSTRFAEWIEDGWEYMNGL